MQNAFAQRRHQDKSIRLSHIKLAFSMKRIIRLLHRGTYGAGEREREAFEHRIRHFQGQLIRRTHENENRWPASGQRTNNQAIIALTRKV